MKLTPKMITQAIKRGDLCISEVTEAVANAQEDPDRIAQIIELANESRNVDNDGGVEIDDNLAIVSEGDDNGAYVSAWVWVSFASTPLTKVCDCCDKADEDADDGRMVEVGGEFLCTKCRKKDLE